MFSVDLFDAAAATLAIFGLVQLISKLVWIHETFVFVKTNPGPCVRCGYCCSFLVLLNRMEALRWSVGDFALLCGSEALLLASFAGTTEDAGDDLDAAKTDTCESLAFEPGGDLPVVVRRNGVRDPGGISVGVNHANRRNVVQRTLVQQHIVL